MSVDCQIKFDNNPRGIFTSGQSLTGTVVLSLDKVRKFRGFLLTIEGVAKCKWTEKKGGGKSAHTETDRDDYLNTILYLLRSSEGQKIELSAGTTKYNFSCQLPQDLPTSFEAKYGRIRYSVHVVLHRPWKFDLTYTVGFTVLKPYDLNLQASLLRNTTSIENVKVFSGGFRTSKPLYYTANIPFSGYVAGQVVDLSIYINNESRVNIEDIHIQLKKLVKYKCQTPRIQTKEEIVQEFEHRCGGVAARNKGNFDYQLAIPLIPPTNLLCRVITVSYALHVTCKVSGLHRNPTVRIPITIGTVPLVSYLSTDPNQQMTQQVQNNYNSYAPHLPPANTVNVVAPSAPYSPDIPMSRMAPPSYMEAMSNPIVLKEEGEHTMGQNVYTPHYPVYNFNNTEDQSNNASNSSAHSYGFNLSSADHQVAKNESENKNHKLL
ncbi:unnamed protein product [Diamesa serratosioi]